MLTNMADPASGKSAAARWIHTLKHSGRAPNEMPQSRIPIVSPMVECATRNITASALIRSTIISMVDFFRWFETAIDISAFETQPIKPKPNSSRVMPLAEKSCSSSGAI